MPKSLSPQPDSTGEALSRLKALTAAAVDSAQRGDDGELMQVLDRRQVEIDRLQNLSLLPEHAAAVGDLQRLEARLKESLESIRLQSVDELKKGRVGRRATSAYGRR